MSNIVVLEKLNGKLRISIDSVHLNQALNRSHCPLPVTEDVLLQLADVKFEQRWFLTYLARRRVIQSPGGNAVGNECHLECHLVRIELSRQEKLDQILEGITDVHRNFDDLLITLSA